MFGIKTKVYNSFAIIFGLLGIIVLALKVFDILPLPSWEGIIEGTTLTLMSLVLFLIGVVIYMRPKMKKLRVMNDLANRYRNDLYAELTKDNKLPDTVYFYQNEEGFLQTGDFVFDGLKFGDALVIMDHLMKDYVMIVYGILDEKKKKIAASKIEYFEYTVKDNNNKEVKRVLVRNNIFEK